VRVRLREYLVRLIITDQLSVLYPSGPPITYCHIFPFNDNRNFPDAL
jgi:hypothetical protein